MKERVSIVIPREVLLIEIERYCAFSDCLSSNRVSLTKHEAKNYRGFNCVACDRWNDDALVETDVPEWWHELKTN